MKIGFIGLGTMGRPMAKNLQAGGHALFLRSRSAVPQQLLDGGSIACASPKEVAERAEVIITMLPDTPDVEAVLYGSDRVAAGLSNRWRVIDMSSNSPLATKEFARPIVQQGSA
jgi:2-hydroxy-3-oxopropionate reductase